MRTVSSQAQLSQVCSVWGSTASGILPIKWAQFQQTAIVKLQIAHVACTLNPEPYSAVLVEGFDGIKKQVLIAWEPY